jgi:hypothetical protein
MDWHDSGSSSSGTGTNTVALSLLAHGKQAVISTRHSNIMQMSLLLLDCILHHGVKQFLRQQLGTCFQINNLTNPFASSTNPTTTGSSRCACTWIL